VPFGVRKTVAANPTGPIWQKPPKARAQIVRRVCEALDEAYGRPRLGNPRRPLDDLVYIILSNKTSADMARHVYRRLRQRFRTWDAVLSSRPSVLRSLLKPAGLSRVKSRQIRSALQKIRRDFGTCDLGKLRGYPQSETLDYLTSLPGVSHKVAKCVMMYTLGADVLPVDSHVHRVATRLGWTCRKRADQCQAELEALVPPKRRYAFHVDCIAHGRSVCRPKNPACERCSIGRYSTGLKRQKCRSRQS